MPRRASRNASAPSQLERRDSIYIKEGEEWETEEVKATLPKSIKDKLHAVKRIEGTTINEQIRLAIIEYYDLDPEEHPPVSAQSASEQHTGAKWEEYQEKMKFEEPQPCKRDCGFKTEWQPALTTHERHHCRLHPDNQRPTREERRREEEGTVECPECGGWFHTRNSGRIWDHKNRESGEHPCEGSGILADDNGIQCRECERVVAPYKKEGDVYPWNHKNPDTGEYPCPGVDIPGDPVSEEELEFVQGSTSKPYDHLVEHGPSPLPELPYEPSIETRRRGGTNFRTSLGQSRFDAVWYIDGHHDEKDVLDTFIDANPECLDAKPKRLASEIGSYGKAWREAWKEIREERDIDPHEDHRLEEPWECPLCDWSTKSKNHINAHLKKAHGMWLDELGGTIRPVHQDEG